MKFLELRPFGGKDLRDVIRYLRADVPKAFNDFFAAVGNVGLRETYDEAVVSSFSNCAGTGTAENVTVLPLNPGTYNVFGIVLFKPNGATGTLSGDAWISEFSKNSSGTVYGQSHNQAQIANVAPYVPVQVFRRLELGQRANVYLGSQAAYSGGTVQRLGSIWALGRQ